MDYDILNMTPASGVLLPAFSPASWPHKGADKWADDGGLAVARARGWGVSQAVYRQESNLPNTYTPSGTRHEKKIQRERERERERAKAPYGLQIASGSLKIHGGKTWNKIGSFYKKSSTKVLHGTISINRSSILC